LAALPAEKFDEGDRVISLEERRAARGKPAVRSVPREPQGELVESTELARRRGHPLRERVDRIVNGFFRVKIALIPATPIPSSFRPVVDSALDNLCRASTRTVGSGDQWVEQGQKVYRAWCMSGDDPEILTKRHFGPEGERVVRKVRNLVMTALLEERSRGKIPETHADTVDTLLSICFVLAVILLRPWNAEHPDRPGDIVFL